MRKLTIVFPLALGLAPLAVGCDDIMSGFDEPNAAAAEPVSIRGQVDEVYDDGAFRFTPDDPGAIVGSSILVFPQNGAQMPKASTQVTVEGRITGTTAKELSERFNRPVDTDQGRYTTTQIIIADGVSVLAKE